MPSSTPQPAPDGRKAGLTAALVSSGGFLVTYLPVASQSALPPSLRILSLVCGFSFLGGFIATTLNNWREIPPRAGIGVGLACGFCAGTIGSVVAAASLLLGIAFSLAGSGHASSPDFYPLVSACMSVVPGIVAGILGGLFAVLLRSPASFARNLPQMSGTGEPKPFAACVPRMLLALLVVAALLSPFFPVWFGARPTPAPVASVRNVTTVQPAPTPIPFHYSKPDGFADADASRLTVIASKSLAGRIANSPISLAPDGKLIAYCAEASSVVVIDITTLAPVFTANVPEGNEHLAWSPDSKRILCVGSGNQPPLTVLDLPSRRLIPLPVNKMASYNWPKGNLLWWAEEEVLIKTGGDPQIFSLDSLRVLPIAQSEKWKALSETDRKSIIDTPTYVLPRNTRWSATVLPCPSSYSLGNNNRACMVNAQITLALDSNENAYLRYLPEIRLSQNDVLLSTTDGSIFIRARNERVDLFYLGLRDIPARGLTATSKTELDKEAQFAKVNEILSMHELRGFVCPPVVNPLNQKVVDADRSQIHALMRFDTWKGADANGWIVQDWQPILPADVIVDPNYFLNGGFNTVGTGWMRMNSQPPADTPLPKCERGEGASYAYIPEFDTKTGHIVFTGISPAKQKNPAPDANTPPEPQAPPPQPASTPLPAATPVATPPPVKTPSAAEIERANKIRAFIRDHHQAVTKHNLDRIVTDYADRVEYFGRNVTRQEINMEQLRFHNNSVRSLNVVLGEIGVKEISPTRFLAVYTVQYSNEDVNGGSSNGICEMYLEIQATPNGSKIVKQSARDKKG